MSVLKEELAPLPIPLTDKKIEIFTQEGFIRVKKRGKGKSMFQTWTWISAPSPSQAKDLAASLRMVNGSKQPGLFAPRLVPRDWSQFQSPFGPSFIGFDGVAFCKPWLHLQLGTIGGLCSSEGYQAESIQAYSTHGTLRLGAAKTKILFRSESGAVTVTGPFRFLQGRTDSGLITIHLSPFCESLNVQTQSGNLVLVVHPGVKARIDFESDQGNVMGTIPYGDQRVEPSVSSRRPSAIRHLLLTIPPGFKPGIGANDSPGTRIRFQTREGALLLRAPQEKKE
jgi:hypothetical protein